MYESETIRTQTEDLPSGCPTIPDGPRLGPVPTSMSTPMRPRLLLLLLALLASGSQLLHAAPARQAEATELPAGDVVLDRSWGSMGVRAAELSTLRATGHVSIEGMEGDGDFIEMFDRRGGAYMMTRIPGFGIVEQGWDGKRVWDRDLRGGGRLKQGVDEVVARRKMRLLSYVPWRRLYASAEVTDREQVDGRDYWQVTLSPVREPGASKGESDASGGAPEGNDDVLYIDCETDRWSRFVMRLPGPSGTSLSVATRFEDWREFEGLWYPYRRIVELGSSRLIRTIEQVELDVELPASRLSLPREIAARLSMTEPVSREPRLEQVEPREVASMRVQVTPDQFGSTLMRTVRRLQAQLVGLGVQPAGPPFARYHRMDPSAIDLEIGFPVSAKVTDGAELKASMLPGGLVATVVHEGSMEGLPATYARLEAMIRDEGHQIAGGQWEVFWTLIDPTVDPREGLTQIVVPVREQGDGGGGR